VTSFNEYVVFSDESRHTQGRFRSIAAVSLPASPRSYFVELNNKLKGILKCGTKHELKWRNIGRGGRNNVPRANAAIDFLTSHLLQRLRCDVLTWDTEDSRHAVEERDDVANYGRMFFHLHRALMKRRGSNTQWHLRPDKQITIDWDMIWNCLNSDGTWNQHADTELGAEYRWIVPMVRTFKEVDSANAPFIQLADLFAGMASYTRTQQNVIRMLLTDNERQSDLFSAVWQTESEPALTDRGRFRVVSHLYRQSKRARLGISLNSRGYLRTPDPKQPINFWHYEPQHHRDKAPTKNQGRDLPR